MNNKHWFNLVKEWKDSGRGFYGLTFPFLVGALSKIYEKDVSKEFIRDVFSSIKENPVAGYYAEVRWCGDIGEPVVSIKALDDLAGVSIKASFCRNSQTSLAFTTDLMSMFHLDCETAEECLEKLILRTNEFVQNGMFSKNNGAFGDFSSEEIKFISETTCPKTT